MSNKNIYKRFAKATNFLSKNDGWSKTNIIDYFIKKFANDDPKMLASIYNDIPDEEKPDLINAINDNDDSDEELLEIYEQIRELHRKNSGLVLISEPSDGGDINITIDDLMRTLNIS